MRYGRRRYYKYLGLSAEYEQQYSCPVRHGAKEHEDVPDGVVMPLAVVGEEIGARGVEERFTEKHNEGGKGETLYDGLRHKDDAPAHDKVQCQRQAWVLAHGKELVERAADDDGPLYGEDKPAEPAAYDGDADGGVGAGYHDIDADMVAFAQYVLRRAGPQPMVDGAGEEHEEHSHDEEEDAHGPLPA